MTLEERTGAIKKSYILIGSTIGLITAGLAPAMIFGYSLSIALVGIGWQEWAAFLAGAGLVVTMEVVGGVSAYVAQNSPNPQTQKLGYGTLFVYTAVGLIYMIGFEVNDTIRLTGIMAYLVAPLLYLAVALLNATLQQQVEREQRKQIAAKDHETAQGVAQRREDERLVWEREQQEARDQRAHEERLEKLRLDAEVRKVKVAAVVTPSATLQPLLQQATQSATMLQRPLTTKQREMVRHFRPGISPTELASRAGVDKATASRWIRNGAMKHYLGEGAQA